MNIVLDISNLYLNGIFVFDKRKNVIIDGYFSRLVYSTPDFVMNGLYIKCVFYKIQEIRHSNSYNQFSALCLSESSSTESFRSTESFDLKNPHNLSLITSLCAIEEYVLHQYKEIKNVNKACVYNLRNQLYGGTIKLSGSTATYSAKNESIKLIAKISGVWETDNSIGLTFKFQFQ